jgi:hypothetical protein
MGTSKNPRTARLLKLTGTTVKIRLLEADRAFLSDLAKVQIISNDIADKYHYHHLKGGCDRSLKRLESAGILRSTILRVPGEPTLITYEFANRHVARAWGGDIPVVGAKRTGLHELLTARAYFLMGRPNDFRVAARLTKDEVALCGTCRPDAVFTDSDTGELVLVEADSGHYTRRQILHKMVRWKSLGLSRQVWVQPKRAGARIPTGDRIAAFRL